MKILTTITRLLTVFVVILSVIILIFLSLISLKKKAVFNLTYYEEVSFHNNSTLFIVVSFFVVFLLILLTKFILWKINPLVLFLFCSIIYVFLFYFIVTNVPIEIRFDQYFVYGAVLKFLQGDYSPFFVGNYMFIYPHQLGLFTLERLILLVFGTKLSILILIYFGFIILINFIQWKIAKLLFVNAVIENLTILLSFLFIPQLFFTLFIYGQVPGLLFLLGGIYIIIYSEKCEREDIKYVFVILAIILFSLASYIRNNYLIFVVAVIIIFLINAIKYKQKKYVVYVLLLIVTNISITSLSNNYYANKIGVEKLNSGMPTLLWVNMGLQENEEFPSLHGWWSGYNNKVYTRNNYHNLATLNEAKEDFKERVDYLVSNPNYSVKFFYNKIETTWLDPYFQSIWAGPITLFQEEGNYNGIVRSLYEDGSVNKYLGSVLNVLLSIVYMLSGIGMLYYYFRDKSSTISLYIPLFFVGTFLFHLVWETKALYVYPTFYMLIPFSAYMITKMSNIYNDVNK